MKALVFSLLLFSSMARAEKVHCEAKKNLEPVLKNDLEIGPGQKALIGEVDEFKIFLNDRGDKVFEIEVFDQDTPSRQYAEGKLESAGQPLKWTLWTRSVLFEVNCRIN